MALTSKDAAEYLSEENTFGLLIYGNLGSGKTLFTSSAQQNEHLANLAYVNADPGLVSIAANDINNIVQISYQQVGDLKTLAQFLKQNHPTVKTVVFDSISALAEDRMIELTINKPLDDTDWRDYGTIQRNLRKIVELLRSAGYNIIMTAGVKDDTQIIDNKPVLLKRRPALSPELGRQIGHFVNYVWHTYWSRDGSYNLIFDHYSIPTGGELVAKSQNNKFMDKLRKLQRDDNPGVIQIGQAGEPIGTYPTLNTLYNLYLEALGE